MKMFLLVPVLSLAVNQTSLSSPYKSAAEISVAQCYSEAFADAFNYDPYNSLFSANPRVWYRSKQDPYVSQASVSELNRQDPEYSASAFLKFSLNHTFNYINYASYNAGGRNMEINIVTPEIKDATLDELATEDFQETFAQVSFIEGEYSPSSRSSNHANFEIRVPVVFGTYKQVCSTQFDSLGNAEKVCDSGFITQKLYKPSSRVLPNFPVGSVRNKETKKVVSRFKLDYNSLEKCLEQAIVLR